jgi:hypothetical protein
LHAPGAADGQPPVDVAAVVSPELRILVAAPIGVPSLVGPRDDIKCKPLSSR